MTKYWPIESVGRDHGYLLELRAHLAWDLIHHFGAIAATDGGEDTAGRQKLILQHAELLVTRCFNIADEFVRVAETREDIKPIEMSEEAVFAKAGQLARIKSQAEYPIRDLTPEEEKERQDRLAKRMNKMVDDATQKE